MKDIDRNCAEVVRDLAAAAMQPMSAASFDYSVLPPGFTAHDLERYRAHPDRIKRKINLATAESFSRYVNAWKQASTELSACPSQTTIQALLECHHRDEAGDEMPSWCSHSATYQCPLDRRWKAWTGKDRDRMTQIQFAEWIEDNHEDFEQPTAAELLDLSTNLQIHRHAAFSSQVQLTTGEFNFAFSENNASGTVAIPKEFSLAIPVFEAGQMYKVRARLRYRLSEGTLHLWYELIKPEKYLEDAFNEVLAQVEEATALTAYRLMP